MAVRQGVEALACYGRLRTWQREYAKSGGPSNAVVTVAEPGLGVCGLPGLH